MNKIKIGILTFCHAINYGAFLQSYALCSRLNQESDLQAELINFKMHKEDAYYHQFNKWRKNIFRSLHNRCRQKTFLEAQKKLTFSNSCLISDDISDFNQVYGGNYDIIIAGSDEIWKIDGMRGFPTPYFLPGKFSAIKMAYAVSGRTPFNKLKAEQLLLLQEYLNDFCYIGVRDNQTINEVKKLVKKSGIIHKNYDPTFVFDFKPNRKNGKKILKERYGIQEDDLCVGIMYFEYRKSNPNLLNYMKSILKKNAKVISLFEWEPCVKNTPDLTPLEWIDVIAALDAIVTMYFHAVCFSIICGTPFYAIEARASNNEESKIYDLLENFNDLETYSLGLEAAINSGRLGRFLDTVSENHRLDYSSEISVIQQDFEKFIQTLRENYMYAEK